MVKVIGPMFTVTASGTVGGSVEFLKWRGGAFQFDYMRATSGVVRIRAYPQKNKKPLAISIKNTLAVGVSAWHDDSVIDAESRHSWIYFASGLAMSGFNRYVQKFVENNPQRESPWNIPSPE